jgi:hypothetical protein
MASRKDYGGKSAYERAEDNPLGLTNDRKTFDVG